MVSVATKLGHGAAKVLGIKLDYRDEQGTGTGRDVTRGESVFSVSSADTYVETEPTSLEWLQEFAPSRKDALAYLKSLFPFTNWILRYNTRWLLGDVIAGITIGAVVVPQGMAYASLADLPPQYGLYTSFMGVLTYWIVGTSKDISIGPVAVMSTITGEIVTAAAQELPDVPKHVVASALAVIAGSVVFFMGLIRIGWIVEFISLAAISAFITGSAFSIAMGQMPSLLGISSTYVDSHTATYKVVIGVLQNLHHASMDAALGLTALLLLYILKYTFIHLGRKHPGRQRLFFFCGTLRTVFVILLYTLISWASERNFVDAATNGSWKLVGTVPRGFQQAAVPHISTRMIQTFVGQIPATVIVLLIEHISISKSFGRINNYTINPSQELLAIGATNLLGPFLGAYPATGSFSRTAINSKAGIRSPLSGVFAAAVVLLAIYALPALFYWIPSAALAGVIIHAVLDLITPANTVYQFWRISPLEVIIFLAGVFVTVFSSIENGIYTTICTSAALLLYRVVKARGRILGKLKVHSVVGDNMLDENEKDEYTPRQFRRTDGNDDVTVRNVFLPIDHNDGSNPLIEIERPYPGIFIYRFSEGFNYPNSSHYLEHLVEIVFAETRRTSIGTFADPKDRPWNNPGPKRGKEVLDVNDNLPTLKAIILDFSSVNNVDITSVQSMIDTRNQLDRYAAPDPVEWHIACINNRWTKRALASAGFGYPSPKAANGEFHRWKPVYSVAEMGGGDSAAAAAERSENKRRRTLDIESRLISDNEVSEVGPVPGRIAVVHGVNRPLFHIDLTSALQSAITNIERRQPTTGKERIETGTPAEPVADLPPEGATGAESGENGSGSGSGSGKS